MVSVSEDLDAKLEIFDAHARQALDYIAGWMLEHPEEIIAVARGRHVTGHYLYGNRNFLEWDNDRLQAETLAELADAVVYESRRLHRLGSNDTDKER